MENPGILSVARGPINKPYRAGLDHIESVWTQVGQNEEKIKISKNHAWNIFLGNTSRKLFVRQLHYQQQQSRQLPVEADLIHQISHLFQAITS